MIELLPLGLFILYLVPFMVAASRNHDATVPILILNLLFGWTVIGWLGLLVLAAIPARTHHAATRRDSDEIGHQARRAMPRILHEPFAEDGTVR